MADIFDAEITLKNIDKHLAQLESLLYSTDKILTLLEKSSAHTKIISGSFQNFEFDETLSHPVLQNYNHLLQRFFRCRKKISSISTAAATHELDWADSYPSPGELVPQTKPPKPKKPFARTETETVLTKRANSNEPTTSKIDGGEFNIKLKDKSVSFGASSVRSLSKDQTLFSTNPESLPSHYRDITGLVRKSPEKTEERSLSFKKESSPSKSITRENTLVASVGRENSRDNLSPPASPRERTRPIKGLSLSKLKGNNSKENLSSPPSSPRERTRTVKGPNAKLKEAFSSPSSPRDHTTRIIKGLSTSKIKDKEDTTPPASPRGEQPSSSSRSKHSKSILEVFSNPSSPRDHLSSRSNKALSSSRINEDLTPPPSPREPQTTRIMKALSNSRFKDTFSPPVSPRERNRHAKGMSTTKFKSSSKGRAEDRGPPAPKYIPKPPESKRLLSQSLREKTYHSPPLNINTENQTIHKTTVTVLPSLMKEEKENSPSDGLFALINLFSLNEPKEYSHKLTIKVLIPIIGASYFACYSGEMTFLQVKSDILRKIKFSGFKDVNPASYHICIRGLRLFDEKETLKQIFQRDGTENPSNRNQTIQIELIRPLDYEINLLEIPLDEPVIVNETMKVSNVINKLCKAFKNIEKRSFMWSLVSGRSNSAVKLDPNSKFISYGFRKEDNLKIVGEPLDPKGSIMEEEVIIQYSPFDSIDKQKLMSEKTGFLKKQGGSHGGSNKSWKKRWVVLENNCLAFYTERKAKVPIDFLNLTAFVSVQEVFQRKIDRYQSFFFSVTTTDRTGPLICSTKRQNEIQDWISSLRQYCNLLRIEQSYNLKITTLEDKLIMDGLLMKSKRRKHETNAAFGSISAPFLARKIFSINLDWEWNSNQNPTEVFELMELLGVGACGKVFKAVHKQMNFELAIKVMKLDLEEGLQEVLEKEIEILKKCRSENVIAYFGLVTRESDSWILMEYCAASSVKDVMRVIGGPLNEIQCSYVIHRTLKGLEYLHSKKILHLDIKAANILLTERGIVKLADFGVSQFLKTSEMTKSQEEYVGSPLYMAPEIIKKEAYNNKADIWSLGITIIEMMEERPPNIDIITIEMLPLLVERPPPTLKPTTRSSVGFRNFLAKILVKTPTDRPSALDLLNDPVLDNIIGVECILSIVQRCIEKPGEDRKRFTFDMLE